MHLSVIGRTHTKKAAGARMPTAGHSHADTLLERLLYGLRRGGQQSPWLESELSTASEDIPMVMFSLNAQGRTEQQALHKTPRGLLAHSSHRMRLFLCVGFSLRPPQFLILASTSPHVEPRNVFLQAGHVLMWPCGAGNGPAPLAAEKRQAFRMNCNVAGVVPTRAAKDIEQVVKKHVPEARISYNPDQKVMDYFRAARTEVLGDDFIWSVCVAGRAQIPICSAALAMGGNVRVGLEDSLYLGKGVLAKNSAEQVEKIINVARAMSIETATPDEAREILGLKGLDKVGY
ncbi:MAG: 3-keto-5-aminohexanoate cleavage protein [Chloroflexi bacterium]|nr:3-keto-5-aminohexanoate cleavage protein [Chloroflexota bacterium]